MANFFGTHRTTLTQDGRGYQWLRDGVPPVSVVVTNVPPVSQYLFIRQQQPDHLQASTFAGVAPLSVRPPVWDTIFLRQQQPDHPLPKVLRGVTIPNVASGIRNFSLVRQQLPDHPLPYIFPGLPPANVVASASYINAIIIRQEMPDHVLAQTPMLSHTAPLEGPWVFGYTVQ